jgi:acyl dehydratase
MYYLKDYWPGNIHASHEPYRVTEEEIIEVGRRWDPRPFHIDPEAAAKSHFGGVVSCSAHLFCIVSWLAHHVDEDVAAVSGLGWNNIRMHAPVRPGDEISLKAVYLESRPSKTRPDCGVVTCRNDLFNQRGKLVFNAEVSLLVMCRPEQEM